MQTLSVRAGSLESARGFCADLSGFHTELVRAEGATYLVQVEFGGSDREILAILDGLEESMTHRDGGPATIRLGDHTYTLHPTELAGAA